MRRVLETEISREVDYFQILRNLILSKELFGLSCRSASEQHIDVFEVVGAGEIHVNLSVQTLMHIHDALTTHSA